MVVEAAFGLGVNVVDGRHTPDHYALDRRGTPKLSRIVGKQVLDEKELKQLADQAESWTEDTRVPTGHRMGVRPVRQALSAAKSADHHDLTGRR